MRIGIYLAEDNVKESIASICDKLGWEMSYFLDISLDKFVNVKDYDVFVINEYWTRIVCRQLLHYSNAGELPCVFTSKGFLPGTQIFDAMGYDDRSWIYSRIPSLVHRYLNPDSQKTAKRLSDKIISNNLTHYHQPTDADTIRPDSVLLPMQFSIDYSLFKSPIKNQNGYFEYLNTVARFCSDHNLELAIKIHPVAATVPESDQNIIQYLQRYPTDAITQERIEWHRSRFLDEKKWVHESLASLQKRYGNIYIVEGNINELCKQSLFIATVASTVCVNALITEKVIATCSDTFLFNNSGAVVYDLDPYISLYKALQAARSDHTEIAQRQRAMLYLLFHDFLLVDHTYPEFVPLNYEKILRQIFLSIHNSTFDIGQYDSVDLKTTTGEQVFGGQWDSVRSLNINKTATDIVWYPKGVIAQKNVIGYEPIRIKQGDSLWSLFGDKWKYVYDLDVNKTFRELFPNLNCIFPGYIIYAPSDCIIKDDSSRPI